MRIQSTTMIFFLALILCLLPTGCGVSKAPASLVTQPAQTTQTPAPVNNTAVFIGDSITYLWGQQEAFQDHANWINKGISGQASHSIARRFQQDVIDLHPREVHIVVGTNDVYPGWELCHAVPGGATPDTPPSVISLVYPPDTCANMTYMVETAKRNGIKVVIGTIPPWALDSNPDCGLSVADETPSRYERINELNTWIRSFAIQEGVDLIDYHAALDDAGWMHYADGMTIDCVHPSPKGYSVMQPLVEAHII